MALMSDISGSALGAGGSSGRERISLGGDRERAFTAARRHSVLVALLRIALPLCSVGLMVFYGYSAIKTVGWGNSKPAVAYEKIDPINLVMDNPQYEGFNKDGGRYVVRAATAQQDLSQLTIFKLNGITGEVIAADKSRTQIAAKRGVYDNKSSVLELFESIDVQDSKGLKAHLNRATLSTKENLLTTSEPVVVEMPTATVRANAMELNQKSRQIVFNEGVHTQLTTRGNGGSDKAATDSQSRLFGGNGGGPIDVDSGELYIDDIGRTARFTGDVKAVRGDNTITTPELNVTYSGQSKLAGENAPEGPDAASGTKVKTLVAQGPVELTRGPNDKATADLLEFDAETEVAVLSGNVVMTQGPDRRVSGDRAEIDSKADTAVLTGAVALTQGRNELHGRRLITNNKTGRTQLSAPADNGQKAGRITSRFYRSETQTAAGQKKSATADSPANLDGGGAFKTDPKAPIDVEADVLDVDDHAKLAVYRGTVHAIQGDTSIRSADLTVHYAGGNVAASDTSRASSAAPPQGGTHLTRLEARGKVRVVSAKSGQTATGDAADCEMKTNMCQISGGEVLLTQGKNVVRGTRLFVDMTTGESRIVTSGQGIAATPAPSGPTTSSAAGGEGKHERPSAVFFPKQAPAQQSGVTSGWSSNTQAGQATAPAPGASTKNGN